jgi:hypothetical protein
MKNHWLVAYRVPGTVRAEITDSDELNASHHDDDARRSGSIYVTKMPGSEKRW